VKKQRAEGKGRKTEDGRQRSEVRDQRTEGKEEGKKIRRLEGQEKDKHRTSNVQHRITNEKNGGQRLRRGRLEGRGYV